ncbi:hypothetical protein [Chryseobacterium ginsengisoli]
MRNFIYSAFLILSFNCISAQESEDMQKLSSLINKIKSNMDNPSTLDSIVVETEKIYKKSNSLTVRNTSKQLIALAVDSKNIRYTSKPIIVNFESLDKDIQRKYSYKFDKFKDTGFIEVKRASQNKIKGYLVIKENKIMLRLVTSYSGNEWLFFDKAIFLIDGKNYQYDTPSPRRDISSGARVEETSDLGVNENMLTLMNAIANSNSNSKIEYRLTGDKYSDAKLTENEKECIALVLDLYNKMTN